ncbi:hypothetical protein B0H10DRAFT_2070993 [Mycena sp. CBHHK59/15]|nr:hypothetical protein B0H10DRAFT_2092994 [Mycena sp. CBHHK59/15]KAJ6607659.1 hypothetical protein B0H10DRAFT_2070993 [Mycena sp. CBHHK59/15]
MPRGCRDCPPPTSLTSSLSLSPSVLAACGCAPPSVHFIFVLDHGRDVGLAAPGRGCWVPCASVAAVVRCLGVWRGFGDDEFWRWGGR